MMYEIHYWPNGRQKTETFTNFKEMINRLIEIHARFGTITVQIANDNYQ